MQDRFIINMAPTGMVPTKEMTPHAAITPDEIIADTLKAAELGASMAHLHARDAETGEPTFKKEIYQRIIGGIREKNPDLILCVSTSGRHFTDFDQRAEVLDLEGDFKPDMASLTTSSMNFSGRASVNSPQMIKDLAAKMNDSGICAELEVFDMGMINYANYMIKRLLLKPPHYFNLILGNIATIQANLISLGLMINELPDDAVWSVGGVGDCQYNMNALGMLAGGGVRVGLEDNYWHDEKRTRLSTNEDQMIRILELAKTLGKTAMTPKETRDLLNIN